MIKYIFTLVGITTMAVIPATAQAPVPVNCVQGCSASGGAATAANQTAQTIVLQNILTGVTGSVPVGANVIGFISNDPCSQAAKTNVPVSVQTAISVQLVALSGSTKIYVCSLGLIGSTATVFSITGGTGTACATSAVAIMGTATATNGISLTANGGLTLGNGFGTVAVTGAGSELCLIQSGSGNISGNLTIVQQ